LQSKHSDDVQKILSREAELAPTFHIRVINKINEFDEGMRDLFVQIKETMFVPESSETYRSFSKNT